MASRAMTRSGVMIAAARLLPESWFDACAAFSLVVMPATGLTTGVVVLDAVACAVPAGRN